MPLAVQLGYVGVEAAHGGGAYVGVHAREDVEYQTVTFVFFEIYFHEVLSYEVEFRSFLTYFGQMAAGVHGHAVQEYCFHTVRV